MVLLKSLFLILSFVVFSLEVQAKVLTTASLSKEISLNHLDVYEKAGTHIVQYLRQSFALTFSTKQKDVGHAAEIWNEQYGSQIKPGQLENLSSNLKPNSVALLIQDANSALNLKNQFAKEYRSNPDVRYRIQKIFIGLMHVIDSVSRVQIGSSLEELLSLKRFLLSQGTFIAGERNYTLNLKDIWWDFIWARGLNFPADIVEVNLKKTSVIAKREKTQLWKERLNLYSNSLILLALHKDSGTVFKNEKAQSIYLRLANQSYNYFSSRDEQASKELKIYLYRYLLKSGYSFEAGHVKNDIAMDVLKSKAHDISKSTSVGVFFQSLLSFLTFVIGFIFVATPIEFLIVVLALLILSRQGQIFFGTGKKDVWAVFKIHRIFTRQGWRRLPKAMNDVANIVWWNLTLAWRMFVTSYTGTSVPFYSKLASSLLIFGIGLYFNSARTVVESIVNQLTMP